MVQKCLVITTASRCPVEGHHGDETDCIICSVAVWHKGLPDGGTGIRHVLLLRQSLPSTMLFDIVCVSLCARENSVCIFEDACVVKCLEALFFFQETCNCQCVNVCQPTEM